MTTPKKRMTKEDVKTVTDKLKNLPMKEKNEFSAREYVQMNKDTILQAINSKGYSYQDIVDLLAEHDVQISVSTLTSYLRTTPPKKPNTRGARKTPPAAQRPDGVLTDVAKSADKQQDLKAASEETDPYDALLASLDDDDAQSA